MHDGLLIEEVAQRKASLFGHQIAADWANRCNNLKKKDNGDWRFDLFVRLIFHGFGFWLDII